MSIYTKLAWRNIFRNKRRSLIAGSAIGLGLAAMMFADALIKGMEASLLESATSSFMGEAQIHGEGFRESFEVDRTIADIDRVEALLAGDSLIAHSAPRVLALCMISSPANLSTITMVGVDPEREKFLTQVDDAIVEGSYLSPGNQANLVMGQGLADLLEVTPGERIVLTVAQAETGDLSQELFRVSGIFRLGIEELDRGMCFIHLDRAQSMLALEGRVHQIALKFTDSHFGGITESAFWNRYTTPGNEAAGWKALLPQLAAAFALISVQMAIMGFILFGIVGLGIANTLFMSLYDRLFEFGVLRAVGTRPFAMGQLIVLEAGSLAILGIIMGVLLGSVVIYILGTTGIDYAGVEFAGATIRDRLYPIARIEQFTVYPVFVFVITMIVGLYPGWYAARLVPAEAMRNAL